MTRSWAKALLLLLILASAIVATSGDWTGSVNVPAVLPVVAYPKCSGARSIAFTTDASSGSALSATYMTCANGIFRRSEAGVAELPELAACIDPRGAFVDPRVQGVVHFACYGSRSVISFNGTAITRNVSLAETGCLGAVAISRSSSLDLLFVSCSNIVCTINYTTTPPTVTKIDGVPVPTIGSNGPLGYSDVNKQLYVGSWDFGLLAIRFDPVFGPNVTLLDPHHDVSGLFVDDDLIANHVRIYAANSQGVWLQQDGVATKILNNVLCPGPLDIVRVNTTLYAACNDRGGVLAMSYPAGGNVSTIISSDQCAQPRTLAVSSTGILHAACNSGGVVGVFPPTMSSSPVSLAATTSCGRVFRMLLLSDTLVFLACDSGLFRVVSGVPTKIVDCAGTAYDVSASQAGIVYAACSARGIIGMFPNSTSATLIANLSVCVVPYSIAGNPGSSTSVYAICRGEPSGVILFISDFTITANISSLFYPKWAAAAGTQTLYVAGYATTVRIPLSTRVSAPMPFIGGKGSWGVVISADGSVFFGTYDFGVVVFRPDGAFSVLASDCQDGLTSKPFVRHAISSFSGNVYFVCYDHILSIEPSSLAVNTLLVDTSSTMSVWPNGTLVLATNEGVYNMITSCANAAGLGISNGECASCGLGTFRSVAMTINQTDGCRGCPQGSVSADFGAEQCTTCGPGYYGITPYVCFPCAPSQYQNLSGATTCISCSGGRFSNTSAQSICRDCAKGAYSGDAANACQPCPRGSFQVTSQAFRFSLMLSFVCFLFFVFTTKTPSSRQ